MFARCASAMAAMDVSPVDDEAEAALRDLLELTLARVGTVPAADRPLLSAAVRVLIDLGVQGWRTSVRGHVVQVGSPPAIPSSVDAAKARVRRQELIKRDEQLRQPSVRRFVQEMDELVNVLLTGGTWGRPFVVTGPVLKLELAFSPPDAQEGSDD